MFPARASLICSREGCGVFSSSTFAVRRNPGVQYPHCAAPSSANASCNGWSFAPSAMPSTVVTSCPSKATPRARQESTGRPSTSTAQHPHSPSSQPCLVPVSAKSSRRTSRSVLCEANATSTGSPFTRRQICAFAGLALFFFLVGFIPLPFDSIQRFPNQTDLTEIQQHGDQYMPNSLVASTQAFTSSGLQPSISPVPVVMIKPPPLPTIWHTFFVRSRTCSTVPPLSIETGMPPRMHMVSPRTSLTLKMSLLWNHPTVLPLGNSAKYLSRLSQMPS